MLVCLLSEWLVQLLDVAFRLWDVDVESFLVFFTSVVWNVFGGSAWL